MASLQERLTGDLKDAMRAGDATRRDEIRGLIAMLKAEQQTKLTRQLSKQGLIVHGENASLTPEQEAAVGRLRAESGLSEDEEQTVLLQRVKQHRQSIEGFQQGKRADLVATEEAQLAVIQAYLPQALGEAEVEQAIQEAVRETAGQDRRDQGKVMGLVWWVLCG